MIAPPDQLIMTAAGSLDGPAVAGRVVENARALADCFTELGYRISTGAGDHLVLLDLTPTGIGGRTAQRALEQCGVVADGRDGRGEYSSSETSCLRLGTYTLSRRGLGPYEMRACARVVHAVLRSVRLLGDGQFEVDDFARLQAAEEVRRLTIEFPLLRPAPSPPGTAMRREPMTSSLIQAVEHIHRTLRPTPVIPLGHEAIDLFAKLETMNPSGSVKDRSAFWILKEAVERGEISRETTVVESSSGNFAVAMASFCRQLGICFVPVVDQNVTPANEACLRTMCPRVEKVVGRPGKLLQDRLARVELLRREIRSAYWPNQYANSDGALAHYRLTGGELCAAFRRIDYVFVGVSTGGTITGLSLRIKEMFPDARVVAVDSEGSSIFGGPPRRRHIPGIGSSVVPELIKGAAIDDVVVVPERDAVLGCHELLNRHGLFAGGSTGSVYAAIQRYFAGGCGRIRPVVLFLCADRGTAYQDTVYNPLWVEATFPDIPLAAGTADPARAAR